eukprot:1752704-Prymnesium_polylepis.1
MVPDGRVVHPTCGDRRCGRPHPEVGCGLECTQSANHRFCAAPGEEADAHPTVELVLARRHLQRAADMGEWPKRVMGPQRHPARAHAKAVPLTSKAVRTRFAARSGSQRMCRALTRSIRLDRQAFLDGLDHHAEKERALPTGSGCSGYWKSTPSASAVPTAQALG